MALEELTNEEKELQDKLDLNDEESVKSFVKSVIRYETDHYVVEDIKTQDPIIISDSDIDENIDFFVSAFNDNMNIPYLDMNTALNQSIRTRKMLKNNELLLYARKKFGEVDLDMTDGYDTDLTSLDTDIGDIIDLSKIKEDEKENFINIRKTDGARLLIEYLIKMRYGGKNMSQLDLIVEKLTYDIDRLNESTSNNKEKDIKDIRRTINIIAKIGDDTTNEWYDFFINSIVTDKRALNLAKEMDRDYIRSCKFIDKIFGPEMLNEFIKKYTTARNAGAYDFENSSVFYFYAMLLFYTLAKKIDSKMKSSDSRSLIYRGYIIHYMLDDLKEDELDRMTKLFSDIFGSYSNNATLEKKLSTMQKTSN
jgi:hypothetical protein